MHAIERNYFRLINFHCERLELGLFLSGVLYHCFIFNQFVKFKCR